MTPPPAPLLQPARRDPWQPFAVIVVGAAALSCAMAVRATEAPAVHIHDAGVEHARGGIGMGEGRLMKQAARPSAWPACADVSVGS